MKILYVGTEGDEAQVIATAVSGLGESVSVSWTSRLDQVARWVDETSGLRALVVEADPNGPAWRSVLAYAAGLPTALPVVVIMPEGTASQPLPAADCIARSPSLLRDLPAAITRAFDRARDQAQRRLETLVEGERAARADVEQRLEQSTAAVREAERRHDVAIAAAAEQLARSRSQYEVGMARAAATRDMVDEQFREAAVEVERARRSHASAVADAERLARRETELSAELDAATATRSLLERRLADAEAALREFQRTLSQEIDTRRLVEDTLAHTLSEGVAAEERHRSAMAAAAARSDELQAVLSTARQALESKAADLDALATREAELASMLAAATTTRGTIERRLATTETAFQEAEARSTRELLAAGLHAAEREAALEDQIRQERVARAALEEEIADTAAALDQARREHQSVVASVTRLTTREADLTSELAARQARFDRGQAEAEAAREALAAQLREAEGARDRAQREHQSAAADAVRLTEREAALTSELAERQTHFDRERAEAEAARSGLVAQLRKVKAARDQARREHQSAAADVTRLTEREAALTSALADATAARRDEQERHDAALATAAAELAERHAQIDRERAEAEATRAGLTAQLRTVEEARDQATREHQSAVADVARLTEREAKLASELAERHAQIDRERAEAEATRAGLTAQWQAVEEARDQARREHQSAVADVARLTEREAALTSELADATAARRDEQERHDAALATAAGELTDVLAQFDRERAETEAAHTGLTAQMREVEEARDQARREHQSAAADVARLTVREADLTSELADVQAAQGALELRLAGVVRESSDAAERAAADREAAAASQADLEARLSRVNETIESSQQTLAETRSAALDAERRLDDEINALRAAALVQAAQFDDHFAEHRRRSESRLAEAQDLNHTLSGERDTLQQSLRSTQEESTRLDREHRAERDRLEQAHTEASAAIQQLTAERQEIERRFEDARSGFQDSLDRLTLEHAAALATRASAIEELRISLTARLDELEAAKRQREVLQAEVDQLPGLHEDLQQSRADTHRLFQQASLPMFRCTKDGALTQANRMLTMLVGRRSPDELRGADFAASVFESPNDLSWLIEKCLGSRGKESTETTWRRKDGSRLLVRVSACATSADCIECGVEDLTPVRVLQDRLSQAHRMEAVGRLAAEVAVTCGNLLRGVQQNAQQWLMTDGSHTASRQQGVMLLEEMSRAAGLLSQLAAYGDEESGRPTVVELNAVVRDMAPVLKRVAGDAVAVEVQLPTASAPLHVDAGAERVQRLLVNLAAYGRERMPLGGRLKIELGTIVVDRQFTAKHPNVRLGPHALVTVTESRRTTHTRGRLALHDHEAGSGSQGSVAVQTSVDLGTLQELVGECGGHLWMTVQPLGDMVVQIRLPLLTSYGQPPERTLVAGGRVRAIANWFQH